MAPTKVDPTATYSRDSMFRGDQPGPCHFAVRYSTNREDSMITVGAHGV